jgi:Polysaccharide biosynthesis protein
MFRYGSVSLTVGIGQQLRNYIYPFLIAVFLSPAAVTLFSLPTKILAIPTEGIGTMTEFVNPIASQLETHKDFSTLRKLIQLSVQAAFLILAPLAVLLIVLGKELLSLWVGSQYTSAYPLLVLLTLGMGAAATQCCVQSMLFGVGRHKGLIWYRVGEGLSIAILGTMLLPVWGLPGLAVAMTGPLLLSSLVLIPRHLCGILNMSLRRYLQEGCLKPCLLALPFAATLLTARSIVAVDKWSTLILVLLVAGLIYLLTLLLSILGRSVPVVNWFSLGVLEILDERLPRFGRPKPQATFEKASPEIV